MFSELLQQIKNEIKANPDQGHATKYTAEGFPATGAFQLLLALVGKGENFTHLSPLSI